MKIRFIARKFNEYEAPIGFLAKDPSAHALMYYALLARKNHEYATDSQQYETETRENEINNFQLFKSVATMYGVEPEAMLKHWTAVDMQFGLLNLALVPDRYRYTEVAELKTGTVQ